MCCTLLQQVLLSPTDHPWKEWQGAEDHDTCWDPQEGDG